MNVGSRGLAGPAVDGAAWRRRTFDATMPSQTVDDCAECARPVGNE